jgi:hypothetical protein
MSNMPKTFLEAHKSSLDAMHRALLACAPPPPPRPFVVCLVDRSGSTYSRPAICADRMASLAIPNPDAYVMFATCCKVVPGNLGMPHSSIKMEGGCDTYTCLALSKCMDLVEFQVRQLQRAATKGGRVCIQLLTDGTANHADAKDWLAVQRRLVASQALLVQRGGGIDIEVVSVPMDEYTDSCWVGRVRRENSDVMTLPGVDVLVHIAGGATPDACTVRNMIRKVTFETMSEKLEPWELRKANDTKMLGYDWPTPMWQWPSEMCADAVHIAHTAPCSEAEIVCDLAKLMRNLLRASVVDSTLVILVKHMIGLVKSRMSPFDCFMAEANLTEADRDDAGAPPEGGCTFVEAITAARSQAARKGSFAEAGKILATQSVHQQAGAVYLVAPASDPFRWEAVGSLSDLGDMTLDESSGLIVDRSRRMEYFVVAQTRLYLEGVGRGDAERMMMRKQLAMLLHGPMKNLTAGFAKDSVETSEMRMCEDLTWVPARILWSRFSVMRHETRLALGDLVRIMLDKQPVVGGKAQVSPLGLMCSDQPLPERTMEWMLSVHPSAPAAMAVLALQGVDEFIDRVAADLGVDMDNEDAQDSVQWCYMCICELERGEKIYTLKTKQGALIRNMVTCESCYRTVGMHVFALAQTSHPARHPIQTDEMLSMEDFADPTEYVPDFPESREILMGMEGAEEVDGCGFRDVFEHGLPGGHLSIIAERERLVIEKKLRHVHVDRSHETQYQPNNPQIDAAAARNPVDRTCLKCKEVHKSRNALFTHLRASRMCCSGVDVHDDIVNEDTERKRKRVTSRQAQRRARRNKKAKAKMLAAATEPTVRKAAR